MAASSVFSDVPVIVLTQGLLFSVVFMDSVGCENELVRVHIVRELRAGSVALNFAA